MDDFDEARVRDVSAKEEEEMAEQNAKPDEYYHLVVGEYGKHIEYLREKLEERDARIEKLTDMLERALSKECKRAEKRMWMQLKVRTVEKVLDLGSMWLLGFLKTRYSETETEG